ncbi:hypothetical protein CYMTET_46571 [Cymbomonas tetramitiformis]|uniref:C2 domain-containing protein n=1 Tax=Cymbomonas tetramitiformis TaxID=36881 RepID=A0AAE0BX47_9CHLO|nr:hypothetical protein CYMTET_46571 [Cymbomonas tetramitiformis]
MVAISLEKLGTITATLHEGRNLLPTDNNGKSDPYVKMELKYFDARHAQHEKANKRIKQSTIKKSTLSPKWNAETFDFEVFGESAYLVCTVFDSDVITADDAMGEFESAAPTSQAAAPCRSPSAAADLLKHRAVWSPSGRRAAHPSALAPRNPHAITSE